MITNDVLPSVLKEEDVRQKEIKLFREANAKYYSGVDWALDIGQGEFRELDIRGVPARLIRRDPETQLVVTRESARGVDWKRLRLKDELWQFSIEHTFSRGDDEVVLVAPKRHPMFKTYVHDLHVLKKAGIALE